MNVPNITPLSQAFRISMDSVCYDRLVPKEIILIEDHHVQHRMCNLLVRTENRWLDAIAKKLGVIMSSTILY